MSECTATRANQSRLCRQGQSVRFEALGPRAFLLRSLKHIPGSKSQNQRSESLEIILGSGEKKIALPEMLQGLAEAAHLHAVSCKVDAQRWLWHLRGHFLGRKIHHPVPVVRAIEAQVLPVWVCLPVKLLDTARQQDISPPHEADCVHICSQVEPVCCPAAHSVVRAFRMPRRRALKSAKMSSGVRIMPRNSDADVS